MANSPPAGAQNGQSLLPGHEPSAPGYPGSSAHELGVQQQLQSSSQFINNNNNHNGYNGVFQPAGQAMAAGSPTAGAGSPSAFANGNMQQQQQQQQYAGQSANNGWPTLPPGLDREKVLALSQRHQQLRAAGFTDQTSPELAAISATLTQMQKHIARLKVMQQQAFAAQQQQQLQQQQQQQSSGVALPQRTASAGETPSFQPGPASNGVANELSQNGSQTAGTPGNNIADGSVSGTAVSASTPSEVQQAAMSPSAPPQHQQHVVMTAQQSAAFKAQIYALRFLQKGAPIPPQIAIQLFGSTTSSGTSSPAAITPGSAPGLRSDTPKQAIKTEDGQSGVNGSVDLADPATLQEGRTSPSKPQDNTSTVAVPVQSTSAAIVEPEVQVVIEDAPQISAELAPYNYYRHPRSVLAALRANMQAVNRVENFGKSPHVPSLLPAGLDAHTLQQERNRFIEARLAQRKRELENLPSLLGEGPIQDVSDDQSASQKIKALIELKSLNLLQRQRTLREDVVRGLNQAFSLNIVTDRQAYRANRKITLKDARMVDQLERQQKVDRENRAKQKHVDQLNAIAKHGRAMQEAHDAERARHVRLGRNILRWHVEAEKEEQKRIERVSKERLKALRNNDEEAYLKLIDTAKDTRITHLLRQTDSFLDSLAQAVAAQQEEATDRDGSTMPYNVAQPTDDGTFDESAFGARAVFAEEPTEQGKVDYYNVAHKIKETISAQPNILVGGKLKDYQIKGLQWMISLFNNRLNGILADEMGLGKTIQTISLITYLIESKRQAGPFLVIVPLSTLPNWTLEFAKWAPSVSVVLYKGSPPIRKSVQGRMRSEHFQVVLTTYEYIIKDRPFLCRYKWIHMIIDEGHRMKNANSKLSQTLTQYYSSRYRLILTGTPLQNNLPELWALLNFVLPKVFNSQKSFDEWFNTPFANTGGQDKIDINEEEALLIIRRLHKVLRPFLLRRLKKDVESELPDKVERLIRCKMSALQTKLYKKMKESGMLITNDAKNGKSMGMKGLQNTIMQLRKICNHPFVFQPVEDLINPAGSTNALLYRVAGKFELLDRILPKLFCTGHRVLMFFQMTEIMNIMEDYLRYRNTLFLRLDGSTKPDERSDMLTQFNAPNSPYMIFLLSTRAGGLGLNLQTADTVIIYDSDWNPHQDLQAQDRAHRIGQKKEVRIFRLVTEKSIEEQILARARQKLEIDKKVIQGGRFDNKSSAAEREDFLRAILENNDDEDEDSADLGDEELNDILARSEEESELFTRMDFERVRNEDQMWLRAGHHLPAPERLITDSELPDVYHIEHQLAPVVDEVLDRRRIKNPIHYDDGLTEEQWTQAIEDEEDMSTVIERNRRGRPYLVDDDQASSLGVSGEWESEMGSPGPGGKKRKRATASASRATSVDVMSLNGDVKGAPKRRKTGKASLAEDPEHVRMKEIMEAGLEAIENTDNEEFGHQCAGLFYKLPSKKDYPEYYIIIQKPICLDQITKKVKAWKYDSLEEYRDDVMLMFNNARTYNEEGSVVWKDANSMQKAFFDKIAEMVNPSDSVPDSRVPVVKRIPESDEE